MFFPTFDTSLWNNFPCTQLWKLTLFAFTGEENDCHCLSFRIFVNWTGLLQKGNGWIPQFEISRFYQFRVSCKFQIISIYSYFHSKNIQQSIPADYVYLFFYSLDKIARVCLWWHFKQQEKFEWFDEKDFGWNIALNRRTMCETSSKQTEKLDISWNTCVEVYMLLQQVHQK